MHIELIDLLRCPRDHADSWLVAAFNRIENRFVIEGKLGCPVCSATYFIRDGVADLRETGEPVSATQAKPNSTGSGQEAAMRAAALLNLTKPNSLVILAGNSAHLSDEVSRLAEARVIALNPTTSVDETERVAVVLKGTRLPFARSSIYVLCLDETAAAFVEDASRVLRQGGRLIAPASTALSHAFRELARDENEIVAESIGELISLSR